MTDGGKAWAGAVVGSIIGSTVTAYVTGDDRVRTNLTFAVPFILLASIGVIKLLSEPPPAAKLIELVPEPPPAAKLIELVTVQ